MPSLSDTSFEEPARSVQDGKRDQLRLKLERGRLSLVRAMQRVNDARSEEILAALCALGWAYLRLQVLIRRGRLLTRGHHLGYSK